MSYFGDTVDPAARIEQQCKALGTWLLVSRELADRIDLEADYGFEALGTIQLRGRSTTTELVTLVRSGEP